MSTSATEICNLIYRYAEAIDEGRLEDAAALFRHARIETGAAGPLDADGLLALWRKILVIHPCGTLRTRHLVTNPILDIDEAVMQATDDLPVQIIASGRYHDRFARIDGEWCFVERDYRQLDFTGDLSRHLRVPVRTGSRR